MPNNNDMFHYHQNTALPDGRFNASGGGGAPGPTDDPGFLFHAVGHVNGELGNNTSVSVIHSNSHVSNSVSVFVIDHEVTVQHSNTSSDDPLI